MDSMFYRCIWRDANYIDGLMQERRNSIANAVELRLSATNSSTYRARAAVTGPDYILQWFCGGCHVQL